MTRHRPYWHSTLREEFCVECGDHFPCLPFRKATGCPVCGHKPHGRVCYSGPCGCGSVTTQVQSDHRPPSHESGDSA